MTKYVYPALVIIQRVMNYFWIETSKVWKRSRGLKWTAVLHHQIGQTLSPASLLCPPPPLHLSQPSLQDLHLLLQVSCFIGCIRAPGSPDAQHNADAHQNGQSDAHGLCVHGVVAQDESETYQSQAYFEQPQSPPQSGCNQSEGEGQQPVANESHKNPPDDKDQTLWSHFVEGQASCGQQENKHRDIRLSYHIQYHTVMISCNSVIIISLFILMNCLSRSEVTSPPSCMHHVKKKKKKQDFRLLGVCIYCCILIYWFTTSD